MESPRTRLGQRLDALLRHPAAAGLARFALVLPFALSGLGKLFDFAGATAEVRGLVGLEPAALYAALVIATQLGGSALMLGTRRFVWLGAGLLGGFTVVATLAAHAYWLHEGLDRARDRNAFYEHVAIVGGLLAAAILAARTPQR